MKVLVKTLEELQQYLRVNSTFKIDNLLPYQHSAIEKYLADVVGDTLLEVLISWYAPTTQATNPRLEGLLPYVQRVVAKFSFYEAAPNLDLQLTDAGFGVVSNQTLAPASKDRVNRFVASLESEGWDAIELLIRYLEKEADNFAEWTGSDAYTMQLRNYINSAEEFDACVNIKKSRLKFRGLRNAMDNVEILRVDPVIGENLARQIKLEIREKTLTPANSRLLVMLQKATANLTAADEIDTRYRLTGEHYLSEVRKMLDKNVDDYPLYRDSIYVAEKSYQRYENEEDSAFFVAGY